MFDYLLTFDEEVRRMRPLLIDFALIRPPSKVRLMTSQGSWGITHVLYIPTRFFPIIGSLCSAHSMFFLSRGSGVSS